MRATGCAAAGDRCGHIGRKGYLKTGAEIMVLRGTVDCAHVLDLMTEYVTTTANTKRMNALNVVILPVTEGKQLTCLGEIETAMTGTVVLLRSVAGAKAMRSRPHQRQ